MLNDTQIKKLKPSEKLYRVTDQHGLCLEVRVNGKKYWYYRFRFDGKATMMLIGEYPLVGLAAARQIHSEARQLLKSGINPIDHQREQAKLAQQERTDTFSHHARSFVDSMKGKSPGYIDQVKRHINVFMLPIFGDKPIKSIDTIDILEMMQYVVKCVTANDKKRGTGEVTAELCRQQAGMIFRHAMRYTRGLHDPTPAAKGEVKRPPIEHARDLTLEELKRLLAKLEEYGGMPSTKGVIWTMLFTMCRTKEARNMRWEHIDWERKLWIIPRAEIDRRRAGDRNMKTDKPHIVPLSNQMIAILEKMRPISGLSDYVFPSMRSPHKPLGRITVNSALHYMDMADVSGHDLRSTCSTYLHGMGFDTQHINLQMAHVDKSVSGIYNHALWLPERTAMMQAWADYLDSLTDNKNG